MPRCASQDNLFEWHFTILGPADTPFEGGRYHGRVVLPSDYPMKPPSILMLTVREREGVWVGCIFGARLYVCV